ncbi:hypothetical protein DRN73_07025 [Candidatus Pacearchaeota archaeon]|nr:MAG: hypothetical protein DRN73_07025 [Candidatus Pacearchaeota archaeon]
MDSFIDNINFKQTELKKPIRKRSSKKSKKLARIYRRLMQLVFFIITLVILWFAGMKAILYTVSFIKGYPIETWKELQYLWEGRYDY